MTQSSKPILHFAHANSFPAGTYRVFFEHLHPHYELGYLEIHGHNPNYPVTNCWPHLVQELVDTLKQNYSEPVILVGHSLGGILSLMVAAKHPELARCVVLLDSPVVAGWKAFFLRIFKNFEWSKRFSPARFSEKRKNNWPTKEAAYQHFASKEMFAIWPPEVLHDYIEAGLKKCEAGYTLRFTREIETQIYLTLPHTLGKIARRGLKVPMGFLGGVDSVECRQAGLQATKKLAGKHFVKIPGGHLIPMESPAKTAEMLHKMISSLI